MLVVVPSASPVVVSFLDRSWWAWNGWIAVGALGTILAAGATLGTLIFFYLQLSDTRKQAAKDSAVQREQVELTQRQLQLAQARAGRETGREQFWKGVIASAFAAALIDQGRRWWRKRHGGQTYK